MQDAGAFVVFHLALGKTTGHLHADIEHGLGHFDMLALQEILRVPENSRVTNASSSSARRSTMRPSGISTISRKDVGMTDALYEDATL